MRNKILIVDDEKGIRDALARALNSLEADIETAEDGEKALELVEQINPAIVITDLRMPNIGGMELITKLNKERPEITTIVITGHATIEDAVQAMKKGAYDFITKPFKKQQIVTVAKRALEKVLLVQENQQLKEKLKKAKKEEVDWGKSREFKELLERGKQAAQSDATILILGESGTGKEILADYIFENSNRQTGPFIKVNCAAIPDNLLESELFGYKKGAFTGAIHDSKGKFLEANNGTIFLDEIGELPHPIQAKLLRVLQNREINPVGGKTEKVDVRILAATNQNLRKKVEEGSFREDLFYRLNVIPLSVPPLRERLDDLTSLVSFFIQKFCRKNKRANLTLSADALQLIQDYGWPGNIRELENAMERAVILCRGSQITPEDLPPELSGVESDNINMNFSKNMTMDQIERFVIKNTLKRFKGNKGRAAEALGISMRTIYRKLD